MSVETELAELRAMVERQNTLIIATHSATFSAFDILTQGLSGVVSRDDIAAAISRCVAIARAETLAADSTLTERDVACQLQTQALLQFFADRLATPPPQPAPMPTLRVVK